MKKLLYILPIVLLMGFSKSQTTISRNTLSDLLTTETLLIELREGEGIFMNDIKINKSYAIDSLAKAGVELDSIGKGTKFPMMLKAEGETKKDARLIMMFVNQNLLDEMSVVVKLNVFGDNLPLDFSEKAFVENFEPKRTFMGYDIVSNSQKISFTFDKESHQISMITFSL